MNPVGEVPVTVTSADQGTGIILVRDPYGREFQVNNQARRKANGFPKPNENWVMARQTSGWVLDRMYQAPDIPVITGSRVGLHPTEVQMLDSLVRQGLVLDTTISDPLPYVDDTNDPPNLTDDDGQPAQDHDPEHPDEIDDPGTVPPDEQGPSTIPDPHGNWFPLYLGSYNVRYIMGAQRALVDLRKLAKTNGMVWGLQEMGSNKRDYTFNQFVSDPNWDGYRPSEGGLNESNIIWRSDLFTELDHGVFQVSPSAHLPHAGRSTWEPRALAWVHLKQKASGRDFYFMCAHLLAHIEGYPTWPAVHGHRHRPGKPASAPGLQDFVQKTFTAIDNIAAHMKTFGAKAPVFTVADWNVNYFTDSKARTPNFPYMSFRKVQTYNNFELIPKHPPYGTDGKRYIDSCYATRPGDWGVKFEEQWILSGYHSDHRPVLIKTSIQGATHAGTDH